MEAGHRAHVRLLWLFRSQARAWLLRVLRPTPTEGHMSTPVIWCRLCHQAVPVKGKVPDICPHCARQTTWTSMLVLDDPKKPWELSGNDRRFLKAIYIDAETHEPTE